MSSQPALLEHLAVDAVNPKTRSAYTSDLRDFDLFVVKKTGAHLAPPADFASPQLIAQYVDELVARPKIEHSTIRRRLVAIKTWLTDAGKEDPRKHPLVAKAIERATIAVARKATRKLAIVQRGMQDIIAKLEDDFAQTVQPSKRETLLYLRDRALLLTLWLGGLTRTEASTLYVENAVEDPRLPDGLRLLVNRTGEMEGPDKQKVWVDPRREREVWLEKADDPGLCAVTAIHRWKKLAWKDEVPSGYLFRGVLEGGRLSEQLSLRSIQDVVRARAAQAGVTEGSVSTHSLRSGRGGALALAGASSERIAEQLGVTQIDNGLADVVGRGRFFANSARASEIRHL